MIVKTAPFLASCAIAALTAHGQSLETALEPPTYAKAKFALEHPGNVERKEALP